MLHHLQTLDFLKYMFYLSKQIVSPSEIYTLLTYFGSCLMFSERFSFWPYAKDNIVVLYSLNFWWLNKLFYVSILLLFSL